MRLKRCQKLLLNPSDYGTRVDYACATRKHIEHMADLKASEYWLYPKSEADMSHWKDCGLKVKIGYCCDSWNKIFGEMRNITHINQAPHFTTGFAAIIMALEWLSPVRVILAGFDNLLNPQKVYRNVLKNWVGSTPHDLSIENRMLPLLGEHYKAEIIPL